MKVADGSYPMTEPNPMSTDPPIRIQRRRVKGWRMGVTVVAQTPRPNTDVTFIAHARADVPALVAVLRESRERERRYAFALKRIARFENRHGPSDEAQIARAALGEQEAPHA